MSGRYDGYTEPLEVLVDILREMKKITELLTPVQVTIEHKTQNDGGTNNERSNKPKNTAARKPSNRRSSNNAK